MPASPRSGAILQQSLASTHFQDKGFQAQHPYRDETAPGAANWLRNLYLIPLIIGIIGIIGTIGIIGIIGINGREQV